MRDDSPAPSGFRIHHTMLPVADVRRAVDFYTRLLGMRIMSERADAHGAPAAVHVGYGDRATQPSLELTRRPASEAADPAPASRGHVALSVGDLRALCVRLEREGVVFIAPPQPTASGEDLRAWIRDPDGHPLELTERRGSP